jgi:DNA-binding CsgD family transcriptional regulator
VHSGGVVVRDRIVATLNRLRATAASIGVHDAADEVQRAACALLRDTIDCDEVLLVEYHQDGPVTRVRTGEDLELERSLGLGLAQFGYSHPAIRSYLRPGDNLLPRRVSDTATQHAWRSSSVYAEVFRARGGHHQLTLVTDLCPPVHTGWGLIRSSADFSDTDLHVATLIWPQLVTMAALANRLPSTHALGGADLTGREVTVLRLLASGLPAGAIAHRLGIAEGTVRKHLERVYTKLDVHDRLSAALRGQELGYITPPTPPRAGAVRTSSYVDVRVDVLH